MKIIEGIAGEDKDDDFKLSKLVQRFSTLFELMKEGAVKSIEDEVRWWGKKRERNPVYSRHEFREFCKDPSKYKAFPPEKRSFIKHRALINNEKIWAIIAEIVGERSKAKQEISIKLIARCLQAAKPDLEISLAQIRKMLRRWGGLDYVRARKDVSDCHERADVVEYRSKFCQKFTALATTMYDPPHSSPREEERVVVIWHDETVVNGQRHGHGSWCLPNDRPLPKKENVLSQMISGFICSCHGLLSDRSHNAPLSMKNGQPLVPESSAHPLASAEGKPGHPLEQKHKIGELQSRFISSLDATVIVEGSTTFTTDHLLVQLEKAVAVAVRLHPKAAKFIFIFDNARTHTKGGGRRRAGQINAQVFLQEGASYRSTNHLVGIEMPKDSGWSKPLSVMRSSSALMRS